MLESRNAAFQLFRTWSACLAYLSELAPKPIAFLVDARKLAADLFELVLESRDAGFEFGTGVVSMVDLSGEMKDVAFELLVPVFSMFGTCRVRPEAHHVPDKRTQAATDLFELVLESRDAGLEFGAGR